MNSVSVPTGSDTPRWRWMATPASIRHVREQVFTETVAYASWLTSAPSWVRGRRRSSQAHSPASEDDRAPGHAVLRGGAGGIVAPLGTDLAVSSYSIICASPTVRPAAQRQ